MNGCFVGDEEHYIRWVFQPRHIVNGIFKANFISLRSDEKGISGQIYERVDKESIYKISSEYAKQNVNYGYAMARVADIRGVAQENDEIDVLLTESQIPAHAEIRFNIDGCPFIGNTPHPRMTYYLLTLKELLSKGIFVYDNECLNIDS